MQRFDLAETTLSFTPVYGHLLPGQDRPKVPDLPWAADVIPQIEVGPGWYRLLTHMNADLIELCPDYRVRYVRSRLGELRMHVTIPEDLDRPAQSAMWSRISEAEALSGTTCENCGWGAATTMINGRYRTFCRRCWKAIPGL